MKVGQGGKIDSVSLEGLWFLHGTKIREAVHGVGLRSERLSSEGAEFYRWTDHSKTTMITDDANRFPLAVLSIAFPGPLSRQTLNGLL